MVLHEKLFGPGDAFAFIVNGASALKSLFKVVVPSVIEANASAGPNNFSCKTTP